MAKGTAKTHKIAPKHQEWIPHSYQLRAVEHLMDNSIGALFLDPGLGKTSVVLETFRALKEQGVARKMLVIAPLRVCQLVWRQEGKRWTQFRDIKFSLVHGTPKKKSQALKEEADIYLINPEGIAWLSKQFGFGNRWPFDTVTIDELTKFKNHRAVRSKKLAPLIAKAARHWGLTGTPAPNGLMDLFGQIKMLDGGRALGSYITHFRDRYFVQGFNGFDYTIREGAAKQISDAIAPYVVRMKAEDHIEMPTMTNDVRTLELPPAIQKQYLHMKKEMILQLPEGVITAANAGAVYSKLKQMANGAVYVEATEDKPRHFVDLHDVKLEALEELVEEMQGKPLLVAYEFRHDLERIKAKLKSAYGDVPHLGHGVTGAQAEQIEIDWNDNKLPILLVHPASAGHGLNFQRGGAHHICWYSVTIDYELYDQLCRRLYRQGNTSSFVINHALVVVNTEDNNSLDILDGKAVTQARLLQSLNTELTSSQPDQGDDAMGVRRLRRKSEVEEDAQDERDTAPKTTKGWGGKASADDGEDDAPQETQRTRVSRRLSGDEEEAPKTAPAEEEEEAPAPTRRSRRAPEPEPEEEEVKTNFSASIQNQLDEEEDDDDTGPAPEDAVRVASERIAETTDTVRKSARRGRATKDTTPEETEAPFEADTPAQPAVRLGACAIRTESLSLAIQSADAIGLRSESQVLKAAKAFYAYISGEG